MTAPRPPLTGFVVDDEPLAVRRLVALLRQSGRIQVVGTATDPAEAVTALAAQPVDVVFLDIHMPEIDGFALLERLERPPLVVFTTAHDEHALRAFEVLAIDYLLKPVGRVDLDRALDKLERLTAAGAGAERAATEPAPADAVSALLAAMQSARAPSRIASRLGDRVTLLELDQISHFHAADKLTFAVSAGREHVIDETLSALERRLDPGRFVRVHRAALVNVAFVAELLGDGGGLVIRLRDQAGTQLPVARDRVRPLKDKLGI
ncbi:MAG TPA: LytTR family DNA-binding domain-containing protein [Kofleriaceae bacterium]|nr:LytTR family DNA-binding domain-containing protein [Kofleriaceae bacterium]